MDKLQSCGDTGSRQWRSHYSRADMVSQTLTPVQQCQDHHMWGITVEYSPDSSLSSRNRLAFIDIKIHDVTLILFPCFTTGNKYNYKSKTVCEKWQDTTDKSMRLFLCMHVNSCVYNLFCELCTMQQDGFTLQQF